MKKSTLFTAGLAWRTCLQLKRMLLKASVLDAFSAQYAFQRYNCSIITIEGRSFTTLDAIVAFGTP
jgi:hypothetical protein